MISQVLVRIMQRPMYFLFLVRYIKFYIVALDDALFEKLKKSVATTYIKVVKELNVDYIGMEFCLLIVAFEQSVFTLEQPIAPFYLYNSDSASVANKELDKIAKRVILLPNDLDIIRIDNDGGISVY